MDILGIGIPELLVILVLLMVAVGPENMVEYAGKAGKWFAKFRRETSSVTKEFKDALEGAATEAELEQETKKNQTPTQWRFTPTQFAVSSPSEPQVTDTKPSAPGKDTSEQDAIALLESLSEDKPLEAQPPESVGVKENTAPSEALDEVLAAAAAEQAAASRPVNRPRTVSQPPTVAPVKKVQPVARPQADDVQEDISDLLGGAFGMDEPETEPPSVQEQPSVVETPAQVEKAPIVPVQPVVDPSPVVDDDQEEMDLLGDALSFSFGDDEDEERR